MKHEWERIPTHDEIGQKINIGNYATIFSNHGTYYTGKIVQRGGKRWFEIAEGAYIGGIGNSRIMKDEKQ